MTKQEVIKTMGQPTALRAAMRGESGEPVEVFEYVLCKPGSDGLIGWDTQYILIFCSGKLTSWGEPHDWQTQADLEGERKLKLTTDENIKIKTE